MLSWFGCFWIYSFLGFLLETVFCLIFSLRLESRKCLLLGTLCPVYGLGGIAVAALSEPFKSNKLVVFFIGMVATSLVEYVVDMFYKELLGVSFWDYTGRPFNLNGRIWLVYSVCWGILSLFVVYKMHPVVFKLSNSVPNAFMATAMFIFACDTILSCMLMYSYKNKNAIDLFWLIKQLNN